MISYLGSLVQFSPAAGRAGLCRQMSLCVGSTHPVLATLGLPRTGLSVLSRLHCSGARLLYMERALRWVRFQFSGPSTNARVRLRLRFVSSPASAVQAARGLGHSPGVRRSFSLCGPSARRRSSLRKSSDRNRGLFAGWEGVASLGLSLPLFPPPYLLPPAGMGRLFSGVSQSLCFANPRQCVPAS